MSYQGDAAEQVVRLSLETGEIAVRLAGSGAKQVAILLYAILKDQRKTKGKTRLSNLLRSGKELKVFAVKDSDLQLFCREAKKYGVLYCVLKDRDATDGITDIMVRAEDASKINRIFERFRLATVDMAQLREEIQRSMEKAPEGPPQEQAAQEQDSDALLDEMLSPASPKEEPEKEPEVSPPENPFGDPAESEILRGEEEQGSEANSTRQGGESGADFATTKARTGESSRSGPISTPKEAGGWDASESPEQSRPSVRQALKEIREEQKKAEVQAKEKPEPQKSPQHKAPKKKKGKQKAR